MQALNIDTDSLEIKKTVPFTEDAEYIGSFDVYQDNLVGVWIDYLSSNIEADLKKDSRKFGIKMFKNGHPTYNSSVNVTLIGSPERVAKYLDFHYDNEFSGEDVILAQIKAGI